MKNWVFRRCQNVVPPQNFSSLGFLSGFLPFSLVLIPLALFCPLLFKCVPF